MTFFFFLAWRCEILRVVWRVFKRETAVCCRTMTTLKSLGRVEVLGDIEEFAFDEALGRGGHVCPLSIAPIAALIQALSRTLPREEYIYGVVY